LIESVIHRIAFSKDNRKTIGVRQIQTILPFFQEEKDKRFSYLKENIK